VGHPHAAFLLSNLLFSGDDLPRDPRTGLKHLHIAAAAGLPVAQHNLASHYLAGLSFGDEEILAKDEIRAVEYFKMASAQQFPPSMMNLAKMFIEGTTVKKDTEAATKLLKKVEALGGSWAEEAKGGLAMIESDGQASKPQSSGSCTIL
jgi:TPR repeat protein